ncbi:MAG: type II toxin-antitoxin system RelE family toxin [Limisphaerales bacterium]
MNSRGTEDFWELYHDLPPQIRNAAQSAFQKFLKNPAHPSLQLERLRSDNRAWSVRVTRNYRAVARRYDNDDWLWFWIGSHEEFDRRFPK